MSNTREASAAAGAPQLAITGTAPRGATTGDAFGNLSAEAFMRLRPSKKLHRNYSMEDLIAPFATPIPQVEKSPLFKFSMVAVAMLMLAIPLLYLGLCGLLALGVVLMIVFAAMVGGTAIGFALGMVALLFFLLATLFFLKPLLAPRKKRAPEFTLDRAQEPVLFAYVDRLCHSVGAPTPTRIDIDVEPNASASFASGMWSMLGNNDLVLTIGLPLAAGLDLKQFTGVLAHEFGHFNQSSAMKMYFIINSMNIWFLRLVFEEDAWDEALFRYASQNNALGSLARLIARTLMLAKFSFWGMMQAGRICSSFLSRQMEFDADRYEARIAGSQTFPYTSMNLQALGLGWQFAIDDLDESWQENRLGDDLPALVMAKVEQVRKKPDLVAKIKRMVFEEQTGWFDTHPATPERIASAQRENAPGIYHIDAPASILFRDFAALCRSASLEYYRTAIGPEVGPKNLISTARLVSEQTENLEALKTLYRYFQGTVLGCYELFLPPQSSQPPDDPLLRVRHLHESRQSMMASLAQADLAVKRLEQVEDRLRELAFAQLVLDVGLDFNPASFNLPNSNRGAVFYARGKAEGDRQIALQQVEQATLEARKRLVAALQLLHVEQVRQRAQIGVEVYQRCQALLVAIQGLERAWAAVARLRETGRMLSILMQIREAFGSNEQIAFQARKLAGEVVAARDYVRHELARVRYPFEHGEGEISLGDFSVKPLPSQWDDEEVLRAAAGTLDRLSNVYYRGMAHLTSTAEKIETAFGHSPLPEPPVDLGLDERGGAWSLAGRR